MRYRKTKRLAAIAGVNAGIIVVGVICIELLFGSWFDPRNRMNNLSILRNASVDFDVSQLYPTKEPLARYTRDAFGLRGGFSAYGQIDILTIGGSTTDQRYIGDGLTWQDVLERELQGLGFNAGVANAGVDGQSTFGHILNFEWWFPFVPGLNPRYAVFYVGINDLCQTAGYAMDSVVLPSSRFSVRRTLNRYSALWNLGRKAHGAYQAVVVSRLGHKKVDFSTLPLTDKPLLYSYGFMDEYLRGFRTRLVTLVGLCRKSKMVPIFVNQPSWRYRRQGGGIAGLAEELAYKEYRYNGVDYYHMMQRIDSVMAEVCRVENIPYIDIASTVDWQSSDFYDMTHMTPSGASKVGRAIASGLVQKGILNR